MTRQKNLKSVIRSRMERTGEKYMVARRHVLNTRPHSEYELRGGIHPETSACANAFANRGIEDPFTGQPITEAIVLGVGGGLGAGYILWEFKATKGHDRKAVVIGFRNQWQYPDRWYSKVCERLGVAVEIHETTSAANARERLDRALDEGIPAIAFVSAADLPYWHLPSEESGWWGYPITIYGRDDDRYLVDDRNHGRLTISAEELAGARSRIPSYKNRLVVADPAASELDEEHLVSGIRGGLEEQIEHLSSKSTSFSLPAFTKWARMLTNTNNAKAWPKVFADGSGLARALVSVDQAIDDRGVPGGSLRGLYADFLDQAGASIDVDLAEPANAYREAARTWADVAMTCRGVDVVGKVAEENQRRRRAVERGDSGIDGSARAAIAIQDALASPDTTVEVDDIADLFADLAAAVDSAVTAEQAALETLKAAVG